MSDRTEQARAEAEREALEAGTPYLNKAAARAWFGDGVERGVEWADANHPAVEALARVRELHRPVESHLLDQTCAECSNGWDLEVIWPCDTYKAAEVDA